MYRIPVYGHQKVTSSILHSVKNHTLSPSILLVGPSSVGKKQVALWTAQTLLCSSSHERPCGQCVSCQKVKQKNHDCLLWIEPEGLNIKMHVVDSIRSFIKLQSFSSCRVILVDQSHRMNIQTQNALLKILEEPPQNVYFLFVCDQENQMLATVKSRMRRFCFYPLTLENMKQIFPDQPDGILRASRGQVERVFQWQENQEISKEIFYFWKYLFRKQRISKGLYAGLKERKTALLTARTWQEILRDARLYQEGDVSLIYPKQQALYQNFSKLPKYSIDKLYQYTLDLEQDILSYLNVNICFENYWNQAFQQIHRVSH